MPTHHDDANRISEATRRRDHAATVRGILAAFATLAVAAGITACSKGDRSAGASSSAPVAGAITASARKIGADSDHAAAGNGLPSGYSATFDDSKARVSDLSYLEREPGRWEVKTGPAHILYSPGDTAANRYGVFATFEQLQAPSHPEAFGIFIGGSHLDGPSIKYTYFMVRDDGKYMVKVRDGANTRTLTDWTANPIIPKQDSAGKALYGVRIDVKDGAASVSVNGAPITTISAKQAPLNGITGVRINHNLHLIVTPVTVIR